MRYLDHLVYAVPDLRSYVRFFEELTGIKPAYGGRHPNAGTENYLVPLNDGTDNPCYMELIGIDATQTDIAPEQVSFGLGTLGDSFRPHLATWAIHPPNIDVIPSEVHVGNQTIHFTSTSQGSRTTPDGRILTWRYRLESPLAFYGLQPLLIDWGETPHPSLALQGRPALRLLSIHAEYMYPEVLLAVYNTLGVDVDVTPALSAALKVEVESPNGRFWLQ
jgi:hypothetical protein